MSGKPAARITDPTACPIPGHGVNPIVQGSPDVLFDGLPAAAQGDLTACGGAIVAAVANTVLINGKPAAVLGSVGAHGNVIISGSGTVIIGDTVTRSSFTPVAPLNNATGAYSGRFQLIDHETGKPAAGRRVRVWSSGGWSAFETTDSEGLTSWIRHDSSESIYIDLVQEGEA